jgi:hypothetical protein
MRGRFSNVLDSLTCDASRSRIPFRDDDDVTALASADTILFRPNQSLAFVPVTTTAGSGHRGTQT